MHVGNQMEFGQALVSHLDLIQEVRDHPDHLAACGHGRISHYPHEPDAPPAKHHPDALISQPPPQIGGQFRITRLIPQR